MIYVGHMFRWQPERETLLFVARRWDYMWCRMWSDKSFAEMSEYMNAMRGRTWLWCQDGNSLPYYLLTPEYRKRALHLGAIIRDWDNPQLPKGVVKTYRAKRYIEKEQENFSFQQETKGGTSPVLCTEEDLLTTEALLRNTSQDAGADRTLHSPFDADSPYQTPWAVSK